MKEIRRPDPDELLSHIRTEEELKLRGKLKIFLGYAAGVGKTFAMLEAAHQRKEQGVDVIIGYIETHGRKDTDEKLIGLEITPRKSAKYHNVELNDMDLDGVLARHPQLVLVDELAHTNIPGLRHPKRYQDVEELLTSGIDVYTTVNIQHFESMNDVVQQITGVTVHETIPDRLLDEASEIEVIDLPPDELIQRIKDGKVYLPDQASRAIEKFFRKGNLTALREISLRRAAERVDNQMRSYMQAESIPGPWPARDRILVCISSHPLGERLIRTGRRLSDDLGAEWIVAFVETPGHTHMPVENQERIVQNLHLAEQLGARIENLSGASVADTVLEYALRNNVTKIIAGKPLRPRWFEILRGGSVVDQIIRKSGLIDIFVISETTPESVSMPQTTNLLNRSWGRYLKSILLVGVVTGLNSIFFVNLEPTNLVMFFLAAVVIAAMFWGRGPSILASLLSVLAFDFFFVNPHYSFAVSDTEYILTFVGFLIVGLVISSLASLQRDQLDQLRKREINAQIVNSLGRELTAAMNLEEVFRVVIEKLGETYDSDVAVLLPVTNGIEMKASTYGFTLDPNEKAVALWTFQNAQAAGAGTDTLPAASIRTLPLKTSHGMIGVLGLKEHNKSRRISQDDRLVLENFTNLSALAIERSLFAEQVNQAESLRITERLQSALLNSISHELRTPLASIMGALTSLDEDESNSVSETVLNHETRVELIKSAAEQTRQLNHLVGNLLDMTRLQSGTVQLKRTSVDIQDLFGAVLTQIEDRLRRHLVEVNIADGIPAISVDAVLIGQALVNMIDNAIKFSPPGTRILLEASMRKEGLILTVQDEGTGVPPEELPRLFEKFYRGSSSSGSSGTGLGLSICRGIVEAHGGRIWAENGSTGGLTVVISLPCGNFEDRNE